MCLHLQKLGATLQSPSLHIIIRYDIAVYICESIKKIYIDISYIPYTSCTIFESCCIQFCNLVYAHFRSLHFETENSSQIAEEIQMTQIHRLLNSPFKFLLYTLRLSFTHPETQFHFAPSADLATCCIQGCLGLGLRSWSLI